MHLDKEEFLFIAIFFFFLKTIRFNSKNYFKNYSKNHSKNYSNYYYYYFSVIILLTLFRMGGVKYVSYLGFCS